MLAYVVKQLKSREQASWVGGGVTVLSAEDGKLLAVPFSVWNNRESGRMAVWMKEEE